MASLPAFHKPSCHCELMLQVGAALPVRMVLPVSIGFPGVRDTGYISLPSSACSPLLIYHAFFPPTPKLCIFSVSLLLGIFLRTLTSLVVHRNSNSFPFSHLSLLKHIVLISCFAIFLTRFGSTSSRARINKPSLGRAR